MLSSFLSSFVLQGHLRLHNLLACIDKIGDMVAVLVVSYHDFSTYPRFEVCHLKPIAA
jgi:hypothetical protein